MTRPPQRLTLAALQVACIGLVAWIPVMGLLSRGHSPWWETLGWLALDVAELAALSTVVEHLHRRDDRVALAATMAVALLLGDATIDLLTSVPGLPRVLAAAMAVLVELPLALLCGRVAVETGSCGWRRWQEACRPYSIAMWSPTLGPPTMAARLLPRGDPDRPGPRTAPRRPQAHAPRSFALRWPSLTGDARPRGFPRRRRHQTVPRGRARPLPLPRATSGPPRPARRSASGCHIVSSPLRGTIAGGRPDAGPHGRCRRPVTAGRRRHPTRQDVLVFCANRRSAVMDELNLMQFIADHASRIDYPTGSSPAQIQTAAAIPAEFASQHGIPFPQGRMPDVVPVPNSEAPVVVPAWWTMQDIAADATDAGGHLVTRSAAELGLVVQEVPALDGTGSLDDIIAIATPAGTVVMTGSTVVVTYQRNAGPHGD